MIVILPDQFQALQHISFCL